MTIEKKELTIPSWVVSLIVPLIITVIGYTIGIIKINTQTVTEIDHLKSEVIRLDGAKAGAQRVEDMQNTLIRIENKIDNYIANK